MDAQRRRQRAPPCWWRWRPAARAPPRPGHGKVSSVPPPATEFITPASRAATAATIRRPSGSGARRRRTRACEAQGWWSRGGTAAAGRTRPNDSGMPLPGDVPRRRQCRDASPANTFQPRPGTGSADAAWISRGNVDMSKTEPSVAGASSGTLEIKDTRTGTGYTVPILPPGDRRGHGDPRDGPAPDQAEPGRVRADDVRSRRS